MLKKMAKGLKRKKPMTRQQKLKKAMGSTEGMTTAQKEKLKTKKAKASVEAMDRRIASIESSGASAKYQQQAQATQKKRKVYPARKPNYKLAQKPNYKFAYQKPKKKKSY
jgi:hypothetical protein